jgi:two-component system sensor histidine kinase VicK
MENQLLSSQHGSGQSALYRVSQLEAENKALQEEIAHLRSSNQKASQRFEEHLANEGASKKSEHRFRTVFEQSILGKKIIGEDLRILQVNPALQTMLGYSEGELAGTRIITYAHPHFVHTWQELQKKLWKEKIPSFGIETCLVRKNGSSFWCKVTSILFQDDGHTLGYTIVEDISDRKKIEEKLKKLYDSQEIVTHTVAHDLKNPIHIIKTLSGFLKKDIDALQEINAQKHTQSLTHLNMIESSCEKAYSIIKDLLLIGEIELGKQALEKQPTEMKSFIEPLLYSYQLQAKEKAISLLFECPQEEVYGQVNKEKFVRVIENLVSNAIKFTKGGGQVRVGLKKESQKIVLQVSDTGVGIPEPLQSSIFQKFTKASRQGTEGEETTGLGLYIVKQIIDLHRGKIYFESEENKGTSFFIELL